MFFILNLVRLGIYINYVLFHVIGELGLIGVKIKSNLDYSFPLFAIVLFFSYLRRLKI